MAALASLRRAPVLWVLMALCATATAQQDRAAQQQRRFQLQIQQLQGQLQEAQAAKTRAEEQVEQERLKAEALARQLTEARAARRQVDSKAQALESERASRLGQQADLERQLSEEKRRGGEALAAKDADMSQLRLGLKKAEQREEQLVGDWRERSRQLDDCSVKNERLRKVGAELIDRYRGKGFAEVLRQREPVLGLSDVATFNLMQDFRDEMDAARYPVAPPR